MHVQASRDPSESSGNVRWLTIGVAMGCVLVAGALATGGCEATLHLGDSPDGQGAEDDGLGADGDALPFQDAESDGQTDAADGTSWDSNSTDTTASGDAVAADSSSTDTTVSGDTVAVDTNGQDTAAADTWSDTQTADPCAGVNCGSHAHCTSGVCDCDAGYSDLGGTCVAADSCQGVSCGTNAHCVDGGCTCDGGFVAVPGGCVAPDPTDPAQRTQQQVCDRWLADWPTRSTAVYDAGAGLGACDPGAIEPVAHDDAMRRLNLYRWLVGLEPSGVDWGHQAKCQAAALMMHANNSLSHSPPSTWSCYSSDGAAAAGASNLGLGLSHPADTVDAYIDDRWSADLGHRRWCFNPTLDQVGFGHYGRGAAMWSFGTATHSEPDFIGYPGPGPFPIDAIRGVWSFHRRSGFTNPQVTVTRASDGVQLDIDAVVRGSSYGWLATISIAVNSPVSAGQSYRVEVVDGSNTWSYVTQPVACP